MHPRPAAFLDRDGTIIADPGHLKSVDGVRLLTGAIEGLEALQEMGYALVLISNRAGIGRGLITPDEAHAVHDAVVAVLQAHGVALAGAYYCDHAPWDGCACRKPGAALLTQAIAELGLDVTRSLMIGNQSSDLEAGRAAGCPRGYLVDSENSLASWHAVIAAVTADGSA